MHVSITIRDHTKGAERKLVMKTGKLLAKVLGSVFVCPPVFVKVAPFAKPARIRFDARKAVESVIARGRQVLLLGRLSWYDLSASDKSGEPRDVYRILLKGRCRVYDRGVFDEIIEINGRLAKDIVKMIIFNLPLSDRSRLMILGRYNALVFTKRQFGTLS